MPTRFVDVDEGNESAIIAVLIGLKPGDDSLTLLPAVQADPSAGQPVTFTYAIHTGSYLDDTDVVQVPGTGNGGSGDWHFG